MEYRQLGKTDITVSAVSLGCWAFAGGATWGPQDEADSVATVHASLESGVNFFDTAEGYGRGESEAILGRALQGRRHEAIIATKASPSSLSREELPRACERSLQRLQTDYIDLYQIHWPSRTIPLDETMAALEKLRQDGKVRAIGVCNFGVGDLSDLLDNGRVETNQLPYSLLWRAIEYQIIPECRQNGIELLCYSPLSQGLLTGKYASPDQVPEGRARMRLFSKDRELARHSEDGCEAEVFAALDKIRHICDDIQQPMAAVAIAWLLNQPGVTSVITGARRPEQITQTARAAELQLSTATMAHLTEATEKVKHIIGSNPDLWSSESRFR